jgi:hypothetical protein
MYHLDFVYWLPLILFLVLGGIFALEFLMREVGDYAHAVGERMNPQYPDVSVGRR